MRSRYAIVIGNILEHYDRALYGFLAPLIVHRFLYSEEPLYALILSYAILPLSSLMRPLGAFVFGLISDRNGRITSLYFSLLGMGLSTALMGAVPYSEPLLFAFLRMLQNFFAAGESPGAAIVLLEETQEKKRSFISSLYDVSSILGTFLASFLVYILSLYGCIESGWRMLYFFGGSTALLGLAFRSRPESVLKSTKNSWRHSLECAFAHWKMLIVLIVVCGFSHVTYAVSFTFMNGFIPLVTSLTEHDVLSTNCALHILDMMLLPLFGLLAQKAGKTRVMMLSALILALSALPLFWLLPGCHFYVFLFVRCFIVTLGVAFAAPYHAWTIEQVAKEHRYLLLSLASSLGGPFIGASTCVLSLWLYHASGIPALAGSYLCVVSIFTFCTLLYTHKVKIKGRIFGYSACS
jgi:MFS family permease